MIDVINVLIQKLQVDIPRRILELALKSDRTVQSVESLVHEKVIQDIVLVDCNLHAGKLKKISLRPEWLKRTDTRLADFTMVGGMHAIYQVPMHETENRRIAHVIDVAYPVLMSYQEAYPTNPGFISSVDSKMDNMLGSYTGRDTYVVPTPIIRGNNIIELTPAQGWTIQDWLLICLLEYDRDFSNISANMVNPLYECVLYAAQRYIYNKLIIELDSASYSAGQELTRIRDIVSDYGSAKEKYDEAVEEFIGAATFDKDMSIGMMADMLLNI